MSDVGNMGNKGGGGFKASIRELSDLSWQKTGEGELKGKFVTNDGRTFEVTVRYDEQAMGKGTDVAQKVKEFVGKFDKHELAALSGYTMQSSSEGVKILKEGKIVENPNNPEELRKSKEKAEKSFEEVFEGKVSHDKEKDTPVLSFTEVKPEPTKPPPLPPKPPPLPPKQQKLPQPEVKQEPPKSPSRQPRELKQKKGRPGFSSMGGEFSKDMFTRKKEEKTPVLDNPVNPTLVKKTLLAPPSLALTPAQQKDLNILTAVKMFQNPVEVGKHLNSVITAEAGNSQEQLQECVNKGLDFVVRPFLDIKDFSGAKNALAEITKNWGKEFKQNIDDCSAQIKTENNKYLFEKGFQEFFGSEKAYNEGLEGFSKLLNSQNVPPELSKIFSETELKQMKQLTEAAVGFSNDLHKLQEQTEGTDLSVISKFFQENGARMEKVFKEYSTFYYKVINPKLTSKDLDQAFKDLKNVFSDKGLFFNDLAILPVQRFMRYQMLFDTLESKADSESTREMAKTLKSSAIQISLNINQTIKNL